MTKNKSKYDYLIPPEDISFPGGGGNEAHRIQKSFVKLFVKHGGLKPDHKVLDIGCGVGRMAIPLTDFLSDKGSYVGFDIVKNRIEWLQKAYKKKHPNFKFEFTDVYNKTYNKTGKMKASEYVFPYADNTFDFIFLTSIFTHMRSGDVTQYLSEISRVLKPGSKCLITFFILNRESLTNLICVDGVRPHFKYKIHAGLTANKAIPEAAIAFHEVFIRKIYKDANLKINEPMLYGSWCKRSKSTRSQDIIVAEKIG